uniref:RNA replicase n=1 Tax=Beihai noda-like virus 14 TaxID=1922467 RepID=A0A1L3KFI6_9VIRU|nr:hypothetical protein [Beihai noda-like virus 14]
MLNSMPIRDASYALVTHVWYGPSYLWGAAGHVPYLRTTVVSGVIIVSLRRWAVPSLLQVLKSHYAENRVNSLLHKLLSETVCRINEDMRNIIHRNYHPMDYGKMRDGHPHPEAARERNAATISMHTMIVGCGYRPYSISPSMREQDCDARRYFFSSADLAQQFRDDPIGDHHIITMTDVDYYVDMPGLISHGRPILCYTMQPVKVSASVSEGHFLIEDNHVVFHVAGGKTVRHRIWDYSQDTVMTPCHSLSWSGAFIDALHWLVTGYPTAFTMVSYVDCWQLSEHRRIVSIVPFSHLPTVVAQILYGTWLTPVQYDTGNGFNAIVSYGGDEPQVSIARNGEFASIQIPLATLQVATAAHRLATNKNLSDTQRRTKTKEEGVILHDYISHDHTEPPHVYVGSAARHYQVVMPDSTAADHNTAGKTYARRFAPPPLGAEAVFPVETPENARASIEGRVTAPQRHAARNVGTDYAEYAEKFVRAVVGDAAHTGWPISVDEVAIRQNRPTQRVRTAQRLMDITENFKVMAFQKREAYNAANAPRNISSVPTMHTLQLSSYTYALKEEVLKRFKWYIPGCTPVQIANRLQNLAEESSTLVETDFSRFDGHIGSFLRQRVEFAVYLLWVHPSMKTDLYKLLQAELEPKAYQGGIKYHPGCSRLSGSPLTSDGNTIINAFVQYATMRKNNISHATAMANIGLICGDDAVVPGMGITHDSRSAIAKRLGLSLKVEREVHRDSDVRQVGFLSRIFLDPWTTPASIQSPKRCLLKIHTTVDTQVDIATAGVSKVTGYLVTDARTPLIKQWCDCYLRNAGQAEAQNTKDVPYFASQEFTSEPWPQQDHGFDEVVADDLGINTAELLAYCTALEQYNGPVDSMPQLSIQQPEPKVDAVQDGEILQAGVTHVKQTEETILQDGSSEQPRDLAASTGVDVSPGQADRPDARSKCRPERSSTRSTPKRGRAGKAPQPRVSADQSTAKYNPGSNQQSALNDGRVKQSRHPPSRRGTNGRGGRGSGRGRDRATRKSTHTTT